MIPIEELGALTTSGPIPSLEEIGLLINGPIEEGPGDIIPGLLPKRGQLVIAGETNVGKSLLSLEIISSLVTGSPLWGELSPTLMAKRVLFVLGEHYPQVIQRLAQVTKLKMTDQVWLLGPEQLGYDKWLVSGGKPNIQAISKFQKWAEGADLVVFDPFSAFVSGVEVENDNIQMRLVLDTMSLISQSAGASCIVLAHQGKPMMNQQGKEARRESYAIRGASAIEDAATNIFYLGAGDGSSPVEKAASSKIFNLTLRKYKGEAPPVYRLLRDPVTLTHSLVGTGSETKTYTELMKMDAIAKVGRLQAAFPAFDYRTCIRVAAADLGLSEETLKRRMGVTGS